MKWNGIKGALLGLAVLLAVLAPVASAHGRREAVIPNDSNVPVGLKVSDAPEVEIKGELVSYVAPDGDTPGSITIRQGSSTITMEVSTPLSAISSAQPGDIVEVKSLSGILVEAKIEDRPGAGEIEVKGTLVALQMATDAAGGSITLDVGGSPMTLMLARGAVVAANLQPGDFVEVKAHGGSVVLVKREDNSLTDDHGRRHGGHGADDDGMDDHGRRHGGHGADDDSDDDGRRGRGRGSDD